MTEKESDLQIQIVQYLSATCRAGKFAFFSIPNELLVQLAVMLGSYDKKSYALLAKAKKMGMTAGASDLLITKGGKAWFIELKSRGKKQTKEQVFFGNWILSTGGKYAVFDNFDEFVNYMKAEGVL